MFNKLFGIVLALVQIGFCLYSGPLPDFTGDENNTLVDFETGEMLEPKLPGNTFEFAAGTPVDWNNDGLFDLIVGYNLRTPDSIKAVVYLNQGSVGNPQFTGRPREYLLLSKSALSLDWRHTQSYSPGL